MGGPTNVGICCWPGLGRSRRRMGGGIQAKALPWGPAIWEAPPTEGVDAEEVTARMWHDHRVQQRWRRLQRREPLPSGAETLQAVGSGFLGRDGGGRQRDDCQGVSFYLGRWRMDGGQMEVGRRMLRMD